MRNALLALPRSDIDIASAASPDQVKSILSGTDYKYIPKAAEFGTVEIHPAGGGIFEHTTFRGDKYDEGGAHRPSEVTFTSSLERDAFRRDFSVNALYADILTGQVYDPTNGLADIKARLIRTTSVDASEILKDDALRIMRLARFAAELGFDIEPKTLETAKSLVAQLDDIAFERRRDELSKLLLSDIKYGNTNGVRHGLELLDALGALEYIVPELLRGKGVEQRNQYHIYDVFVHCMMSAVYAPPELTLRLAGLLHDVGKPEAIARGGKMLGHDVYGTDTAHEMLKRLRYSNAIIDEVTELVRHHMYDLSGQAKEKTLRKWIVTRGKEMVYKLALLREADVHGSGVEKGSVATAERWRSVIRKMEAEGAPFSEKDLKADGSDIARWLGIPPGVKVGEVKRALLIHCAVSPSDNIPEKLERLARGMR